MAIDPPGTLLGHTTVMLQGDRAAAFDVVCLSHLRWNFVFQRPQHLMTRCARDRRVYYVEEPVVEPGAPPDLRIERCDGVTVVCPVLPAELDAAEVSMTQRRLLDAFMAGERITDYVLWYYTPMALLFTDHLDPRAIVYDCMDELSAFRNAPPMLRALEADLMQRAALVLTGGHSLYEAKRHQHGNLHAFPSSVDVAHFRAARCVEHEPADQQDMARPRLGFFGVIDERMDLTLLAGIADMRPQWQLVMLGPVVKIDAASLPARPNIHCLGSKPYRELPRYIAGWDVALMPFARNEATRFISPTKTPEYMAAGKPVVSTSIADVVRPYGERGLVRIADDVESFVAACETAMREDPVARLRIFDRYLKRLSWDLTWSRMLALVNAVALSPPRRPVMSSPVAAPLLSLRARAENA
jgi:UDP-galactopyranose mutase